MANTLENILVGTVVVGIRQPNDSLAQWSTVQHLTNAHSVKLSKGGSGTHGSAHVQFTPLAAGLALKLSDFEAMGGAAKEWGYMSYRQAVNAYWSQMEYRFTDPNDTDNYVDVTVQIDVMDLGGAAWLAQSIADTDMCGIYGRTTYDGDMGDFALEAISGVVAKCDTLFDLWVAATAESCADWTLTRVRIELWEDEPPSTGRYEYIDCAYIDSVEYSFTPGSTTVPGLELSSPYTDIGYTDDGVNVEPSAELNFIRVDEEVYPVNAVIASGGIKITCNMAEASLANLNAALAGSVLTGNTLTLGGGVLQKMSLRLTGLTPAGYIRSYEFPKVVASGAVGMSYKRAEKTIIPVTFEVLKPDGEPAGTFVDNAA